MVDWISWLGRLAWKNWGPHVMNSFMILFKGYDRDISVIDAMLWLGYGPDTTHRPSTNNPPLDEYNDILDQTKVAHRAGDLIFWGKPEGKNEYERIPPSYWDRYDFDVRSICWDDPERFQTKIKPTKDKFTPLIYTHLMTNKARVQGVYIDKGRLIRK